MADPFAAKPLAESLRWLDRLEQSASVRTIGAWPLGAVLEHLAQSVEMSMEGFPVSKSPLFQQTVGRAAFATFRLRGRMSHGLDQPIPGAPSLSAQANWLPAAVRLRTAIERFRTWDEPLRPHFAYGPLSKADFALAHHLHIANHRHEILAA